MMISLLIPTRDRAHYLDNLLNSLQNSISNKQEVEILFKIDRDDSFTQKILIELRRKYLELRINEYIADRSDYLNRDYYNYLASNSNGKYLWAVADDVIIKTKDWDGILQDKIEYYLENHEDRIAYISVNEIGSQAKHPCFPLITKEAFKVLKMYFHPEIMTWGADRCIYELYSSPKINRVLHIEDIEIIHKSYHDGTALFDKTAASVKERFFRDKDCHNKCSMYTVPQQIKIINKYIEEFNNARVE